MIFPPRDFTADESFAARRGVASVVFGVRAADGTPLVCKRLNARAASEPEARAGLLREGEILAVIAGSGAPRLVESDSDERGPFVVMERLAMPTLAEARAQAQPQTRALYAIAARAFEALALVHEAGVVHGDVSPENVLASVDGARAAIIDFGLARIATATSNDGPLADGAFRGTLAYAAPEVARGEALDARSDLFALAATVLAVASGTPPRTAAHDAALLVIAGERPVESWAREAAAGFAPDLADMLVRCVAFDRNARPASARDVLARASRAKSRA